MSLRNSLRHATELQVASPKQCNTQLSGDEGATRHATATQQQVPAPGISPVFSATPPATGAQPGQLQACNSGQKLHVAFANARNTQLGGLTVHRLAGALVKAINVCCDARGDNDANRAGLIAECSALTAPEQADMREHFEQQAVIWLGAARGGPP